MIVIDGKEYRNLEEQVLKNMEDIKTLKEEQQVDILNEDNIFNGNNTFKGNLYRPNTNGGGQLIVNHVMSGISYSDDGDQTGQVAVTSAGTSITGLVSPVNDNDAANKQYVDNAISGIDLSEYVQKTTQANKLYGTDDSGNYKTYTISRNPSEFTSDSIAQRGKDGNVYVPRSPLDDFSATSRYYVNNTRVAKVNTSNIVYGRGTGIEKTFGVGTAATANNIVQRKADGQITVPTTPSADTDAASKKYVDDSVTASVAGVASIGGATGAISLANGLAIIQNALQINKDNISIDISTESAQQTVNGAWRYGNIIVFHGNTVQPFVGEGDTIISSPDEDFTYAQFGVIVCGGQVGTLIPARETFEFSSVASGNFFGFILM